MAEPDNGTVSTVPVKSGSKKRVRISKTPTFSAWNKQKTSKNIFVSNYLSDYLTKSTLSKSFGLNSEKSRTLGRVLSKMQRGEKVNRTSEIVESISSLGNLINITKLGDKQLNRFVKNILKGQIPDVISSTDIKDYKKKIKNFINVHILGPKTRVQFNYNGGVPNKYPNTGVGIYHYLYKLMKQELKYIEDKRLNSDFKYHLLIYLCVYGVDSNHVKDLRNFRVSYALPQDVTHNKFVNAIKASPEAQNHQKRDSSIYQMTKRYIEQQKTNKTEIMKNLRRSLGKMSYEKSNKMNELYAILNHDEKKNRLLQKIRTESYRSVNNAISKSDGKYVSPNSIRSNRLRSVLKSRGYNRLVRGNMSLYADIIAEEFGLNKNVANKVLNGATIRNANQTFVNKIKNIRTDYIKSKFGNNYPNKYVINYSKTNNQIIQEIRDHIMLKTELRTVDRFGLLKDSDIEILTNSIQENNNKDVKKAVDNYLVNGKQLKYNDEIPKKPYITYKNNMEDINLFKNAVKNFLLRMGHMESKDSSSDINNVFIGIIVGYIKEHPYRVLDGKIDLDKNKNSAIIDNIRRVSKDIYKLKPKEKDFLKSFILKGKNLTTTGFEKIKNIVPSVSSLFGAARNTAKRAAASTSSAVGSARNIAAQKAKEVKKNMISFAKHGGFYGIDNNIAARLTERGVTNYHLVGGFHEPHRKKYSEKKFTFEQYMADAITNHGKHHISPNKLNNYIASNKKLSQIRRELGINGPSVSNRAKSAAKRAADSISGAGQTSRPVKKLKQNLPPTQPNITKQNGGTISTLPPTKSNTKNLPNIVTPPHINNNNKNVNKNNTSPKQTIQGSTATNNTELSGLMQVTVKSKNNGNQKNKSTNIQPPTAHQLFIMNAKKKAKNLANAAIGVKLSATGRVKTLHEKLSPRLQKKIDALKNAGISENQIKNLRKTKEINKNVNNILVNHNINPFRENKELAGDYLFLFKSPSRIKYGAEHSLKRLDDKNNIAEFLTNQIVRTLKINRNTYKNQIKQIRNNILEFLKNGKSAMEIYNKIKLIMDKLNNPHTVSKNVTKIDNQGKLKIFSSKNVLNSGNSEANALIKQKQNEYNKRIGVNNMTRGPVNSPPGTVTSDNNEPMNKEKAVNYVHRKIMSNPRTQSPPNKTKINRMVSNLMNSGGKHHKVNKSQLNQIVNSFTKQNNLGIGGVLSNVSFDEPSLNSPKQAPALPKRNLTRLREQYKSMGSNVAELTKNHNTRMIAAKEGQSPPQPRTAWSKPTTANGIFTTY